MSIAFPPSYLQSMYPSFERCSLTQIAGKPPSVAGRPASLTSDCATECRRCRERGEGAKMKDWIEGARERARERERATSMFDHGLSGAIVFCRGRMRRGKRERERERRLQSEERGEGRRFASRAEGKREGGRKGATQWWKWHALP